MKRVFPVSVLVMALLLVACSTRQDMPALPTPEECPYVYVAAPGNYIIDIASGAEVILDPGVREFPLFCSVGDARAAVREGLRSGELPEGDWRIYRLDGDMEDLGQVVGDGRYSLGRMAQIIDWVTDQPQLP